MQVEVRTYSGAGAKALMDLLEANLPDIESRLRAVAGLVSYTLARSIDGGFSVTVCEDSAGIENSSQIAKDWVGKNAVQTGVGAPQVSDGVVILNVK